MLTSEDGCDASGLAVGVVLAVNGTTVEDAAWLRKRDDHNHINVAELEAVLKGVNLTLKWGFTIVYVMTDSAAVYNYVMSVITTEKRVRTKGATEMIIKRRLGTLGNLLEEFGLQIQVALVSTEKNKADALTRIKKKWLLKDSADLVCSMALARDHEMHHLVVDRTLYLASRQDPHVKLEDLRCIIQAVSSVSQLTPHQPPMRLGIWMLLIYGRG